jgi:hypothetical protein
MRVILMEKLGKTLLNLVCKARTDILMDRNPNHNC